MTLVYANIAISWPLLRFKSLKKHFPQIYRFKRFENGLEKKFPDLKFFQLILAENPLFFPDFPDWKKSSKFSLISLISGNHARFRAPPPSTSLQRAPAPALPPLVTSGGQDWIHVQTCSLEDLTVQGPTGADIWHLIDVLSCWKLISISAQWDLIIKIYSIQLMEYWALIHGHCSITQLSIWWIFTLQGLGNRSATI